jgi:hypothetical protein
MLTLLDELLRTLLMNGVSGLRAVPAPPAAQSPVTREQVAFRPPNDGWVKDLKSLQLNAFNVYLVDLRENRKLRSNERVRSAPENGLVYAQPAPARLDCHYLISAWSPTDFLTPSVEPSLDEHTLLYEAAAVLMQSAPFNPSRVYPANSAPLNAWPLPFRELDLPAMVAPVEGFPKLAEFWGTMEQRHPWKPVLYLIVTVPVELLREAAGPMVTTRITEYRQAGKPETAEVWIQIGGQVTSGGTNPVAVEGAWVQLETLAGVKLQTTETNALGRFTFADLPAGRYRLRARAGSLGELLPVREVTVPSPTGEYDLRFP